MCTACVGIYLSGKCGIFSACKLSNHSCEQDIGYWIHCDVKPMSDEITIATDDLSPILGHSSINTVQQKCPSLRG